jgi:RimJ/RimL family protein N-acetyltransferase
MPTATPPVLTTARTTLRLPDPADAPFFLELLNDPEFVRTTGDRGIRDLDGARGYITDKLLASHATHGFTFWVVELQTGGPPVGICGLAQRPYLDAPDIGFAFLPAHRRHGLGLETARGVLQHARRTLHHHRLLGITRSDNPASCRLLENLGLRHVRTTILPSSTDTPTPDPLHRIYQFGH